jgi:carboxypeptidase C (cathepsin A)
MALFAENGPFSVADDGMHLLPNNNSWNQLANVLYIESPAGTGFSYATSSQYSTNDTLTRDDAYSFVRAWLRLFPEYQSRPLYLSGESYAGHYVPQLAEILLQQPIAGVNLQGFLIGNPYTDISLDTSSVFPYLYNHGFCSPAAFQAVMAQCYNATDGLLRQEFTRGTSLLHDKLTLGSFAGGGKSACQEAQSVLMKQVGDLLNGIDVNTPCSTGPMLGCLNFTAVTTYLNSAALQQAIGVYSERAHFGSWMGCSMTLNYTQDVASVLPLYPLFFQNKLRVLIYSGDATYDVPFLGTSQWAQEIGGQPATPGDAWKAWAVSNTSVGGYVARYPNLTFMTVLNAGHMAPYYQPQACYVMFQDYISGAERKR